MKIRRPTFPLLLTLLTMGLPAKAASSRSTFLTKLTDRLEMLKKGAHDAIAKLDFRLAPTDSILSTIDKFTNDLEAIEGVEHVAPLGDRVKEAREKIRRNANAKLKNDINELVSATVEGVKDFIENFSDSDLHLRIILKVTGEFESVLDEFLLSLQTAVENQ